MNAHSLKLRMSPMMALIGAISLVAPMAAHAEQSQRPARAAQSQDAERPAQNGNSASGSESSTQQGQRPAGPNAGAFAADMGVSEEAVRSCMPGPDQSGNPPERPNAEDVTDCLNEAGAQVSTDQVKSTLKKFAPPAQN